MTIAIKDVGAGYGAAFEIDSIEIKQVWLEWRASAVTAGGYIRGEWRAESWDDLMELVKANVGGIE